MLTDVSVELYLVRPTADGRVIFPFWDEDGDPQPGVDAECISSLKWATWSDPEHRLGEAGIGPRFDPIPPDELVAGARLGLEALLDELGAMHPDFGALANQARGDTDAVLEWLDLFIQGEVWTGDGEACRRAYDHATGPVSGFVHLFERILKGGLQGRYGCWSF
jgi:hypothetical protein